MAKLKSLFDNFLVSAKAFARSITIEPTVFLFVISISIVASTQIMTDLLIYKMCSELGYNQTVCDNLGFYPDEQTEVGSLNIFLAGSEQAVT